MQATVAYTITWQRRSPRCPAAVAFAWVVFGDRCPGGLTDTWVLPVQPAGNSKTVREGLDWTEDKYVKHSTMEAVIEVVRYGE